MTRPTPERQSRFRLVGPIASMAFGLFMACLHSGVTVAADRPPNIVLIVADDISRDWLSCYGSPNKTPMIDRLTSEGAMIVTAWATPLSTPSRVMLLTGRTLAIPAGRKTTMCRAGAAEVWIRNDLRRSHAYSKTAATRRQSAGPGHLTMCAGSRIS